MIGGETSGVTVLCQGGTSTMIDMIGTKEFHFQTVLRIGSLAPLYLLQ